MKNTFSKKLLIPISIAIILSAGFLVFSGGVFKAKPVEQVNLAASINGEQFSGEIDVAAQDQLNYKNETIPLLWSDNNDNENLIIKTDRQYYDAGEQTEIFFSVSNQNEKDQKTDIVFWFDNEDKKVESVERVADNQILNFKFSILNQFSIPKFSNRKDIKSYTNGSKFQDTIASGQTNYYRAIIKFPKGASGEFFVEAFGSNGAYGLLDPYYASGLVGMWTFNGPDIAWQTNTAYDRSGTSPANNGTIINMSTTTSPAPGISGQALKFDGVDDYVNVGATPSLNITGAITISAWIYPEGFGGGSKGRIVDKNANVLNGYLLMVDNINVVSGFSFLVNATNPGTEARWSAANAITLNTWQHVVASFDGTYVTLYKNGIASNGAQTINAPASGSNNFVIGGRTTDNTRNFAGIIDEVRVYNRALSASEISDLYRLGSARLKVNSPITKAGSQSGLIGNWTFNGPDINNTTNSAYNRSSSYATGTMMNMATSSRAVPGISGQALSFDGVDDYVNVPSITTGLSSSFTFFAWVAPSIAGTTQTKKFLSSEPASYYWANLGITSYKFVWALYDGTNNPLVTAPNNYVVNEWVNVVGVRDVALDLLLLYLNGALVGTITDTTTSIPAYSKFAIGRQISDALRYFPGRIDEVRVYSRALTASEITDLYRLGSARLKANSPITKAGPQSGLVGNWTFNGQDMNWASTTAEALDRSGNNNNGNVVNFDNKSAVPGISGQALYFDRVDDYVDLPSLPSVSAPYTVSLWFYPKVLSTSNYQDIYNFKGANPYGDLFLFQTNNLLLSCGQQKFLYSSKTFSESDLNKWWHVSYVIPTGDSLTNWKIYINGTDSSGVTGDNSGTYYDPGAYGRFGSAESQYYFNGLIDEVRVYNRALSASEITDLYRLGSRKFQPTR